jgi:hypothetical protein
MPSSVVPLLPRVLTHCVYTQVSEVFTGKTQGTAQKELCRSIGATSVVLLTLQLDETGRREVWAEKKNAVEGVQSAEVRGNAVDAELLLRGSVRGSDPHLQTISRTSNEGEEL